MVKSFDVVIEEDKNNKQFFGSVPSLPGCYSISDSVEELIPNMKEAISLYLAAQKQKKIKLVAHNVLGMVKVYI